MAQVRPNEPSRPALLQRTLKFSSYLFIWSYLEDASLICQQTVYILIDCSNEKL
jgi:hypothetical protein